RESCDSFYCASGSGIGWINLLFCVEKVKIDHYDKEKFNFRGGREKRNRIK
ncbi:hypothetical protein S83_023763, partial [Arachis hypogaea]